MVVLNRPDHRKQRLRMSCQEGFSWSSISTQLYLDFWSCIFFWPELINKPEYKIWSSSLIIIPALGSNKPLFSELITNYYVFGNFCISWMVTQTGSWKSKSEFGSGETLDMFFSPGLMDISWLIIGGLDRYSEISSEVFHLKGSEYFGAYSEGLTHNRVPLYS